MNAQPIADPRATATAHVLAYLEQTDWATRREQAYRSFIPVLQPRDDGPPLGFDNRLAKLLERNANEFLLADFQDERGQNPIDDYLARRGWRESAQSREWLCGLRAACIGIYRIRLRHADGSLSLTDILRGGQPLRVRPPLDGDAFSPPDFIKARIVAYQGELYLTGAELVLPRGLAMTLRQELREFLGGAAGLSSGLDWKALLRYSAPYVMTRYTEHCLRQQWLGGAELDDEPIEFGTVRFEFAPSLRNEVIAALAQAADIEPVGECDYEWISASGTHTAAIHLAADHGVVSAGTRLALHTAATVLQACLPSGVRFPARH